MNEPLRQFWRHLELKRGYSAHTLSTYHRVLADSLGFLEHAKLRLRRRRREDLRAYVSSLRRERQNSSRSIQLKLQVLKSFLGFLAEHHPGAAPKLSLTGRDFSYKVEHKDVESLSEEQLNTLLQTVAESHKQARHALESATGKTTLWRKRSFAAQRDLALLALLIGTGLRIAEALVIGLGDLDFVDHSILIHGKGKKLRKVFFDLEGLSCHLLPYIEARRAFQLDHDRLFVEIKSYAPLRSRGFQKRLKEYLLKARLRPSISPHALRHSFATVAIDKGANIKAVSQILGHANCKTTIDLYTHLSSEHLRAIMQRCDPLSREVIPIEERIEMRKKLLAYLEKTG